METSTRLITSGCKCDLEKKIVTTINPPIYTGSTVLMDCFEDLDLAGQGKYDGISYGTDGLPTQHAFEESMRQLEKGYLTRAFQSGISAITAVIMAYTRAGDHILVCDNAYGPTTRFCKKILARYNVATDLIPPSVGMDVKDFIKKNTRLIFMESPGSNTFEIQDIPAVTAIAQKRAIVTVLDNTWATPLYLNPFDLGVDVSIQSVTKYISGHSDVLLGAVTVNEQHAAAFEEFYSIMEIFAPSNDCYLALRGLKTLEVRLKQHERSAMEIARWLETCNLVDNVIHPALETHPEHRIWKRDFTGSSGLFAFTFKADYPKEKIAQFVNTLTLFGIGYSWGGFKSLITASKQKRETASRYAGKTIIRLNIGLEDVRDLIQDLENSMDALGA